MNQRTKILVLRFSSIGDIVLCSPVFRHLKQTPCELHFLCKKKFAYLAENNPNIDQVHVFEDSVSEVLPQLKSNGFDYIIDLHNNIRTKRVKSTLGSKSFTFRKLNVGKWLLCNLGIDRLPNLHVVDRYMETLSSFDIKPDDKGLDFFFPTDFKFRDELISHDKYVVAAIGGQHEGKKMPSTIWLELFEKFDYPVYLIGGPEDETNGKHLAEKFDHVINLCGRLSVFDSAYLMKHAQCVISNDTGMMHIASAFNKPIISLWGQTTPKFGMSPYKAHEASLILEPEKKRTLSKLGNKKTSEHVMLSISTDKIVTQLQLILQQQKAP